MYRVVWECVVGLVAGIGCLVAVVTLPVDVVVGTAVTATLIGVAVSAWPRGSRPRRRARHLIAAGGTGGYCAVGMIGTATAVGTGIALLVAVGLAASSPWTVRRAKQWRERHRPPRGMNMLPTARVRNLSDQELCRGWRSSHDLMRSTGRIRQQAELAALRQSYLDELERRHPAEFACWLYGDASSANDPGRYLSSAD